MANKQIVPYDFYPNKNANMLALSVVPLEITPIRSSQSYFAQAIRRPVIAPLPPCPLLEGKPRQQEPRLDV